VTTKISFQKGCSEFSAAELTFMWTETLALLSCLSSTVHYIFQANITGRMRNKTKCARLSIININIPLYEMRKMGKQIGSSTNNS
jgi:hypothetical protein